MVCMSGPRHIAIILDGNRRYAASRGKLPWQGHHDGRKNVEKLLGWAKERNIKELTLYAFSLQNFQRPDDEVRELFLLLKSACDQFLSKDFEDKHKIRIQFIGRTHLFPDDIQEKMLQVENATAHHQEYLLNFCVAYGGREEIVDAVKVLAKKIVDGSLHPDEITEEVLGSELWLKSEPDMIIRTSGEQRLSNFLLWQGNYAELFFVDKHWPEFTEKDFQMCIDQYDSRQRRFGQ